MSKADKNVFNGELVNKEVRIEVISGIVYGGKIVEVWADAIMMITPTEEVAVFYKHQITAIWEGLGGISEEDTREE